MVQRPRFSVYIRMVKYTCWPPWSIPRTGGAETILVAIESKGVWIAAQKPGSTVKISLPLFDFYSSISLSLSRSTTQLATHGAAPKSIGREVEKSVRSALQNTVGWVSRSRDLYLFGLTLKPPRSPCLDSDRMHAQRLRRDKIRDLSHVSLLWMTNEWLVCSERHWYRFCKYWRCFWSWTCVHSCPTCVSVRKKNVRQEKHWIPKLEYRRSADEWMYSSIPETAGNTNLKLCSLRIKITHYAGIP